MSENPHWSVKYCHMDKGELMKRIHELEAQLAEIKPYIGHQQDCEYIMFPDTAGCDCGYLELQAILEIDDES